jgi:hypothetical protein
MDISPVFLNVLKMENKSNIKRNISNNHRDNYTKMNKSNIFDENKNVKKLK